MPSEEKSAQDAREVRRAGTEDRDRQERETAYPYYRTGIPWDDS